MSAATVQRYGYVAMTLHWVIAAMIVAQYFIAESAEELPLGIEKIETYALHKSLGITVLVLALARLIWRFVSPPPPAVEMPTWQTRAASAAHWGFYALLFLIPLSGWLYSSAEAFSVSWWGWVQLPDLIEPSESAADVLHEIHEIAFFVMLGLLVVHVGAALKHQFVDRDGALLRMLPRIGGNG